MIFAFDRDFTVDCAEDPGPVPLEWVKALAIHHNVWAVGNPKLGPEAGLQTHHDLKQTCADRGLPIEMPPVPLNHLDEKWLRNAEGKVKRLYRLSSLCDDTRRIVVDDIDLSTMPGWLWVSPRGFVQPGLSFWLEMQ